MAVQNSIVKKAEAKANIVEYESGGQMVKLSAGMIKKYLVSGGGNVTDQEVMLFLSLCKFQKLNPFLRDAYLIKYGNSPATMVVGKDVLLKRARRNPDYIGKQAGVIVQDIETGEITEREGTFYISGKERLLGGWAKVFIKGYDVPEYAAVSFAEYAGRTRDGKLNSQWATKPATMIRKVALVHALREAFPEELGGMYSPEEVPSAGEIVLDETPIVDAISADAVPAAAIPEAPPIPAEMPAEMPAPDAVPAGAEDVASALFG